MKKLIFVLGILFLAIQIEAQLVQPNREVVSITQFSSNELTGVQNTKSGIRSTRPNKPAEFIRKNIMVPLSTVSDFFAFSIVWEAQNWSTVDNQLWVRFKGNGILPKWQQINIELHSDKNERRHISELTFVDKDVEKIDVKIVFEEGSTALVQNLKLHFYNPGSVEKKSGHKNTEGETRDDCFCPQPDYEDRADWCPSGNCPEITNPTITDVTHLIVHHSAGVNTSSDWAAIVRSIWDFHVIVNGWDDIGYNYLVDPNGVLYEGRGDNVRGAHFCGNNGGTMGVCMMGDYTTISPTDNAKETLKDLLAWKICDIDGDPEETAFHASSGLTLNRISGHQDGCATACPGASFYPQLANMRTEIADQITNECEAAALAAPSNLIAEATSLNSVELNWNDNSNNENTFIIERSIWNNNNYELVGNTSANVNTFTDGNLQANTAYFYKVKATNDQGMSAYSNQVGVATVSTSTKNVGSLSVEIYPNPVENWLSISLPKSSGKELIVQIYEMGTSKLAMNFKVTPNGEIIKKEISDLPKGIYLLQVSDGLEYGYVKLVKR